MTLKYSESSQLFFEEEEEPVYEEQRQNELAGCLAVIGLGIVFAILAWAAFFAAFLFGKAGL